MNKIEPEITIYAGRDTGYFPPLNIDARDSDRMELPDAPNASRSNAPMAIASFIVFILAVTLVVHLVRVFLQN